MVTAAMCAALAGEVAAAPYDLLLVEKEGETTLAVRDLETHAVAFASGDAELRILDPLDSEAFFLGLVESGVCGRVTGGGEAPPPKIVIHKMDYDEDPADVRAERQTRLRARDRLNEEVGDGAINDAAAPQSPPMRSTRLVGVDAVEAARFIDAAPGLSPDDAATIKEKLGL
jgi:hypothetical protein